MNVRALRRPMSLEQFLAWEERQELRYEFDGVRPEAMTGGTAAHAAIQRNLLATRLRGNPCQAYGSELKIMPPGRIRNPDAFVVCTPVLPRASVVAEPVIIFEVLSDSTSTKDLVVKNAEYRATSSVQRYVILAQDQVAAIVFSRNGDNRASDLLSGPDAMRSPPEIGIAFPLSELFLDIAIEEASAGDFRTS